jgi:hypothetical protein
MGTLADTQDQTLDAAASAFGALDAPEQPREEGEQPEENGIDIPEEGEENVEQEGDEPSADEPEAEQAPEKPAIDAPASWTPEHKAAFAQLPPDTQQFLAARESERERFIHAKSQETAAARREVESASSQIQSFRQYAEMAEEMLNAYQPQRPDYGLIATDPAAYAQKLAEFEAQTDQRNQLAHRSLLARQQAAQFEQLQRQQAVMVDYQKLVAAVPEYADASKRGEMLQSWTPTAEALGYPTDRMSEADSTDLLALRKATEWRTKAEKWDQAQQAKMATVRSAKPSPKVATPGTAQPKGSERARGFNDSMNRLRQSGDVRDAAAALRNLR